jgi:hypothetical protein
MDHRIKRFVSIGSSDADDLSTLKTWKTADNGPAELSGGIVGEYEELVVLTDCDGAGE